MTSQESLVRWGIVFPALPIGEGDIDALNRYLHDSQSSLMDVVEDGCPTRRDDVSGVNLQTVACRQLFALQDDIDADDFFLIAIGHGLADSGYLEEAIEFLQQLRTRLYRELVEYRLVVSRLAESEPCFVIGWLLWQAGEAERAVDWYWRSLGQWDLDESKRYIVWSHLGVIYSFLGDFSQARVVAGQAIEATEKALQIRSAAETPVKETLQDLAEQAAILRRLDSSWKQQRYIEVDLMRWGLLVTEQV